MKAVTADQIWTYQEFEEGFSPSALFVSLGLLFGKLKI